MAADVDETGRLNAPEITLPEKQAAGGYAGAEKLGRQLASWHTSHRSADGDILGDKTTLDDRSNDMQRNDAFAAGAIQSHRDSIVGSQFKLSAKPDWKVLRQFNKGFDDTWAAEFQEEIEPLFTAVAEGPDNWLDASGMNTLTAQVRLVIGVYALAGEVLATGEWIKERDRPISTAIQLIDTARLCNPDGMMDGARVDGLTLRGGLLKNRFGHSRSAYIRESHPGDFLWGAKHRWKKVDFKLPWGRQQVFHIVEQQRISQSRGVGQMVSALKEMRMKKRLNDIELQNIVANAVYAMVIESDLPPEAIATMMGGDDADGTAMANYLEQLAAYSGGGKNLHQDGVKFPILFPGTKLNMQRSTSSSNSNFSFDEALMMYIAKSAGMSYEEFSGNFQRTNYSSARAAMGETWKFYQARRKLVAERYATSVYTLAAEEFFSKRMIQSLPAAVKRDRYWFWRDPLIRAAICRCGWLGAPRPVIDQLKNAQANDIELAHGGLTYERYYAEKGLDWREELAQKAREQRFIQDAGVKIIVGNKTVLYGDSAEDSEDSDNAADDNSQEKPRQRVVANV